MKILNKVVSSFSAVIMIFSSVSGVSYAESNNHTDGKSVNELISELNASEYGIPSGITQSDIDRVINEGGMAGAEALQHIYNISLPVDYVLEDDIQITDNIGVSNHYSYKYNVNTGLSEYVNGDEFDYKPTNPISPGSSPMSSKKINTPTHLRDYPYWWYESSPQSYDNTRSTCRLTIVTTGGATYRGSGFLISNGHVGTAGHCLYDNDYGYNNWCAYVIVTPSSNGSATPAPYGSITSSYHEVGGNWADYAQVDDDWGIITLSSNFYIGYMSMWNTGTSIYNWGTRAQGWRSTSNDMYLCRGNVTSVSGRLVDVSQDVFPGMSGGPLLEDGDNIIGFVRGYTYSGNDPGYGPGRIIRLDDWLYNKFTSCQ